MIGATRSIVPTLRGAGLALIWFAVVYAPAFAAVAWLRPGIQIAIPIIIAVSAGVAALIILLSRDRSGIAEFGVAKVSSSYVLVAAAAGVLVGAALAYLAALHPARSPIDLSKLQPWMIFVYFVLAAPVQEELIFRGLLQTTLSRVVPAAAGFWAVHFPVGFIAVLFGLIHLDSGVVVAAGAVLLGLIAGELRRMSGSLAPAVLFHALLNAAAALWPAP